MESRHGLGQDPNEHRERLMALQKLYQQTASLRSRGPGWTRVIELHPGRPPSPLKCSLKCVCLDLRPHYETLSYAWGDLSQICQIEVDDVMLEIPPSLLDFLKVLRCSDTPRILWADAICINQTDAREKSLQIPLMRRIYRQATNAHIWLGDFCDDWFEDLPDPIREETCQALGNSYRPSLSRTQLLHEAFRRADVPLPTANSPLKDAMFTGDVRSQALNVIREVNGARAHLHHLPFYEVLEDGADGPKVVPSRQWIVISGLVAWIMTRPWWKRLWTLQETILPEADPNVHIGSWSFLLSEMTGRHLMHDFPLGEHLRCCRFFVQPYCAFDNNTVLNIAQSATLVWNRARLVKEGRLSLAATAFLSRLRITSKPVDYASGIIGLIFDDAERVTVVEYPDDKAKAFLEISRSLFNETRSLHELQYAGRSCHNPELRLPSWAIDFEAYRLLPRPMRTAYNASGQQEHFESADSYFERSYLYVLGLEVYTMVSLGRSSSGMLVYSYLDDTRADSAIEVYMCLKSWYDLLNGHTDHLHRKDAFWRTVFRDTPISLSRPSSVNSKPGPLSVDDLRLMRHWWARFSSTIVLSVRSTDDTILQEYQEDDHLPNANVNAERDVQILAMIQNNIDRFRFFCTSDGTPGLGPLAMSEDDHIFVLAGCPAPAVLRRRPDLEARPSLEGPWEFIGLCFLPTCMYGEAMSPTPAWQSVVLC